VESAMALTGRMLICGLLLPWESGESDTRELREDTYADDRSNKFEPWHYLYSLVTMAYQLCRFEFLMESLPRVRSPTMKRSTVGISDSWRAAFRIGWRL
jgi:hypothetical protein